MRQKIPSLDCEQFKIIKGDDKCKVIGAASIIAKFIRDFIIRKYDRIFPFYNLYNNVGYGTKEHIENIRKFQRSFLHRSSFKIKSIDR